MVSSALVAVVWALIIAAGFVQQPGLKSVVLGAGVAVAIACKPLRRLAIEGERIGDDIQDVSQTAFQRWLWESMRPSDTVQQAVNLGDAEIAQELPTYDLASVRKAHHLAIVGATGAGKTQLTQWLVACYFQGATVRVYDPDAAPGDWGLLPVVGMGVILSVCQVRCWQICANVG
jgi:ABC-type transport system involved in cytochrome bd biosynthesis fused ATPase/permease subunit